MSVMSVITVMVARKPLIYRGFPMTTNYDDDGGASDRRGPSRRIPISMGKNDPHDDGDGHDDESQRFSKGARALCCGAER
jgi:hypothetical protein